MGKKVTVKSITFPPEQRVLVVSDVHGNLPFLKGLLEQVAFDPADGLILLGDLIEKGPDSLATLRYIMDLSRTHTVYPVCGNCDDLVLEFLDEGSSVSPAVFAHYFRIWGERSLLIQMGRAVGLSAVGVGDLPRLRADILDAFGPELDFLRAMPHILISRDYLFVHGGVPGEMGLEELDAWACMKNDDFYAKAPAFHRWCVVGHTPVTLYDGRIASARPLLDYGRHVASIDGGCCLKLDGQLNALILPRRPGDDFSWTAYDGLETAVALEDQAESKDSVNVRWGRSELEVLERGVVFCRCRHLESGRVLDVLTEFLREKDGKVCCEDATDYRLPITPGDRITVVREVAGGCLAKKEGVTGWYFGQFRREMA